MSQPVRDNLVFDAVVVDFAGRRVSRAGIEQPLEPKAFAVLALLTGQPGRAFTRDELLDAVWGHRHVTQGVLNRVMSLLRQALGEDAQHPRRLHTVHGVGYRFELPDADTETDAGIAPQRDQSAAGDTAMRSPPAPVAARPDRARWPWLVAAAAVLLAVAALAWWSRHPVTRTAAIAGSPPASPQRPSLAVLPFADLSQSRDQQYLADGLAEDILHRLVQSPALRVIGRTSSFSFKDRHEDLRSIGRALDAAYLLEGSVRRDGDRLRVTAQLIRAADGSHLWSRTYARELRDVFAVQDEISTDVAQALSVTLDVARFSRERGGTTDVDAYERFLRWRSIGMRGQFEAEHDRERLRLAREMVALDPHCALCWDALARSLAAVADDLDEAQAGALRAEAREARERIARIAPGSWIAQRDRANALWREGRRAEALALAGQLAASGPLTHERVWDYAFMTYAVGHLDDTTALVEQVRANDPMLLYLSRDLQYDYTATRRYADAEAEYRRGQVLDGSQQSPDFLAFCRQLAGQRPGDAAALRELHTRLRQDARFDTPFFRDLGTALEDREAMRELVRRALADETYGGGARAADVWTAIADALGDADLAVAAMRRTLENAEGFSQGTMPQRFYVALWNAPYSGVRAHPDFKRLLIETGVADYWRQTGRWGDGCEPLGSEDFRCR
ncbi:MAG TPA: winged helix-turn-helix domain-containing protein [Dokdonella sp.]|uniref:winged helix-turn-helix domain-containing protein n=1 Tax=Dokdonella sp. TaxID=2291710 RepID=UPI002BCD6010|nr:winged helix-turn-helix domain-containing protein [Dokdonella sp.]HUD43598.1 winged helix-turn-helix domain-containing protein [Dokdonella sp.]